MARYKIQVKLLRNIFGERKLNCFWVMEKEHWWTPWRAVAEAYEFDDALHILNNCVYNKTHRK